MKRKLQVFVSSTYTDLIEERQAAVAAILEAGHIPAGMELFTAGDQSQMEIIKKWVDESDVYMLILGGRYGSIERNSGLSYTEWEYDYAVEKKKPLFALVIKEDAQEAKRSEDAAKYSEARNVEKLEVFRGKILKDKVCGFFSDRKDIKNEVLKSLSKFAEKLELKGWVPASEIERLQKENALLKNASGNFKTEADFLELFNTLKAIKMQTPVFGTINLQRPQTPTRSLLYLLYEYANG